MRFDGKTFGQETLDSLQKEIQEKHLTPHLAVIIVGDDPASKTYVEQKRKKGEAIGITVSITQLPTSVTQEELNELVTNLNQDTEIDAIIIQRPFPKEATVTAPKVELAKDVDGFEEGSTFTVPVVAATITILKEMVKSVVNNPNLSDEDFFAWVKTKQVAVVGRGVTAGGPTISFLENKGIHPEVISSHTENPAEILKKADIVISAVGKEHTIQANELKQGVLLVGVGLTRNAEGKLVGDYNDEEIDPIAGWYTPTPGGVGPVNVSMLLKNVVTAASNK